MTTVPVTLMKDVVRDMTLLPAPIAPLPTKAITLVRAAELIVRTMATLPIREVVQAAHTVRRLLKVRVILPALAEELPVRMATKAAARTAISAAALTVITIHPATRTTVTAAAGEAVTAAQATAVRVQVTAARVQAAAQAAALHADHGRQ